MQPGRAAIYSSAVLLLGLTTLVAAHGDAHGASSNTSSGHDSMSGMSMEAMAAAAASKAAEHPVVPSYFHNAEYQGWLYAHILSMVVAWVIILPIGKQREDQSRECFLEASATRIRLTRRLI